MPLTDFYIYFILHGTGTFGSDPEGDEEYQLFFANRLEEIQALGHISAERIFGFLEEEVYGIKRKEATAEQRRQREFSGTRLEEIRAQAAREDAEEEGAEEEDAEEQNGGDQEGEGDQKNEAADEN